MAGAWTPYLQAYLSYYFPKPRFCSKFFPFHFPLRFDVMKISANLGVAPLVLQSFFYRPHAIFGFSNPRLFLGPLVKGVEVKLAANRRSFQKSPRNADLFIGGPFFGNVDELLPFEIHYKGEVLVTGKFLRSDSWSKGPILHNHVCSFTTRKKLWIMECNCAISGSSFFSSKTDFSSTNAPFLEVYVVGRSLGQPVVLNHLVQLVPLRRKNSHNHIISLDAILEDDDEEEIVINALSQV